MRGWWAATQAPVASAAPTHGGESVVLGLLVSTGGGESDVAVLDGGTAGLFAEEAAQSNAKAFKVKRK